MLWWELKFERWSDQVIVADRIRLLSTSITFGGNAGVYCECQQLTSNCCGNCVSNGVQGRLWIENEILWCHKGLTAVKTYTVASPGCWSIVVNKTREKLQHRNASLLIVLEAPKVSTISAFAARTSTHNIWNGLESRFAILCWWISHLWDR